MGLIPILCLAWNQFYSSYVAALPGSAGAAEIAGRLSSLGSAGGNMSHGGGSETTIFLALLYAGLMIVVSIYRNLRPKP